MTTSPIFDAEGGGLAAKPAHERRRASIALTLAALVTFAALSLHFREFVLDDAFISFRYAQNLANGDGAVFNPGQDPVEGFTSYVWLLLAAASLRSDLDPIVVARLVNFGALALILALLVRTRAPFSVRAVGMTALAVSPPTALLAMQGLETVTTGAILFVCSWLALRQATAPSQGTAFSLVGCILLALLSRPDSAPFAAGLLLGLVGQASLHRRRAPVRTLLMPLAAALLLGASFMIWRHQYYGHWLPNTFYLKFAPTKYWFLPEGVLYSLRFLGLWIIPVALATTAISPLSRARLGSALPIVLGAGFHLLYLFTVNPVQGFLGRFGFPVFPSVVLAVVVLAGERRCDPKTSTPRTILVLLGLTIFNLLWLPQTHREMQQRTQVDRVAAGKALHGLDGVLFTSAAGALPYYSRWPTVDRLGLTSEEIAHHGLSVDLLEELGPDLVAIPSLVFEAQSSDRDDPTVEFLTEQGLLSVACVRRNERFDFCYFADPDSPLLPELERRLHGLAGITYTETKWLEDEFGIPPSKGRPRTE